MKKLRLLICIILVACCLSVLSACKSLPAVQTPANVKVNLTDLSLSWRQIKDVRLYTVSIQPAGGEAKEYLVSKNNYSLAFLDAGEYTIRVKANGKEDEIEDSPWSEPINFVREQEPGLVMTLSKDRESYEVTEKGIATGDIVIPDTYRGKPVTSIGKKAFFNKSDVTSITFGKNITVIGDMAFANCSYLADISVSGGDEPEMLTLPEGLTSLGANAFSSCRALSGTLVMPANLTTISEKAFAFCGKISSIQFADGLQSIGKNAFVECGSLVSVTLPDSLITIDEYAFSSCEKLAEVKLGNRVEILGAYAFSDLPFLRSIQIPDSVKSLGEGCFWKSTNLQNVELGTGIESIDLGAFMNTALWDKWDHEKENEVYAGKWFLGLWDTTKPLGEIRADTIGIANQALAYNKTVVEITLPDSVKIIGEAAFAGCEKLASVIIGSGVEIIGEQAFASNKELISVKLGSWDKIYGQLIDSSLKTIGNNVFHNCAKLESIEIPASVTSIGSQAFKGTALEAAAEDGVVYADNWIVGFTDTLQGNVTVRENTVGISVYAFVNCDALTGIEMPNSVKYIGRGAFYNCFHLVSVALPNTLEVIEDYTFYHCDRLQLFALPPALRVIGRSAFYKCGSVYPSEGESNPFVDTAEDGLLIPHGVTSIGDYAFYGCGIDMMDENSEKITYGIDIVVIGDSVTYMGASAFYGFASLREVVIGDALVEISEKAFQKCNQLETITFGESVQVIGEKAFYKCEGLEYVEIPDNVQKIGNYAFYRCTYLRTVKMGDGVTEIGNYAFYACTNLGNIRLSTSLQTIGKQAFRNCYGLKSVVLASNIQQIMPHAFYGCNEMTIYAENAQAGENWDRFWNSAYRPVIWECTLSEGKEYVVSFTKSPTSVENKNMTNTITVPTRIGYVCIGWNTNAAATEAVYTSETIVDVTDGRKLYAIWVEEVTE